MPTTATSTSSRRSASASSSSDDREEMIDVVSHAPAALHAVSERGSQRLRHASSSGVSDNDAIDDGDDGDDDDEEEEEEETEAEYAYRRGRHTIPMHSPGEDLADIDLLADQHLGNSSKMPRLPRLRNRVFFQGDDAVGVATTSAADGGGVQTSRRVLFRRRKRQEGDVFWTAILVSNVLSFAVLGCLVVYLTQTDFFASHQNELFGTTVDNRFTVVSQQDARAKIYLKSGYSNSRYSEAMIAFGDGVLQLGRRALTSTDAQRFYGLSLSHNGTAAFTNKLTAPTVATDYLHAGKAVVFEDGTVMTTAANMSGGVKEVGDLNLVSKSGSVITSAGGKPVLIVDPLGTVAFPNADAEEPSAMGIVLDGTQGRVTIGGSLHVDNNANTSSITTAHALHMNTTRVVFGSASADKVTLTVSHFLKDSAANEDSTSSGDGDDEDVDVNDTADEDDERETRKTTEKAAKTAAPSPVANLQKRTNMEIVGQSSSSQSLGGDVWIAGGDGLDRGGNVIIAGGVGLDLDELRVGSVAVNAQLDPTGKSFTEIGTQGGSHVVYIQGDVVFNGNKTSTDNTTQVTIAGAAFNVETQQIAISNAVVNASTLRLDSNDLRIGASATTIEIGSAAKTVVSIQAHTTVVDATQSIAVGHQALQISIGNASRSGQSIELVSDSIRLSSSGAGDGRAHSRMLESAGATAVAPSLADVELNNGSVSVEALRLDVGASGNTKSITLDAFNVSIGRQSLNSSVEIDGETFSVSSENVQLGAEESATVVSGETIALDGSELITIGEVARHIEIGSKAVEDVNVHAKTLTMKGSTSIAGKRLLVNTVELVVGGKATEQVTIGDQSTKKAVVEARAVEIGAASASVTIGSASPEVSIGSANGVINLKGKVTLNGNAFESRRQLSAAAEHWFGYLNADRFAIETPAERAEFALPFGERYVSDASTVQFGASDDGMGSFQLVGAPGADAERERHVKLSLNLDGVRLRTTSSSQSSKLRCRVYRQRVDGSPSPVLEAVGAVEHCSGSECDSEVFIGVSSERIIRFDGGDRFDVRCSLSSWSSTGQLVVDGGQLWFTKL